MDQNAIISKIKSKSVAKLRISAIAIVFTYREAFVSRIMLKICLILEKVFSVMLTREIEEDVRVDIKKTRLIL